jgi:hypothetical protein
MKTSYFSKDIQEFLSLLAKHKVRYMIVGGEAVIYYGHARLTGDLDFYYVSSKENADNLYRALDEFWGGDIPGLANFEELIQPGIILQFGLPPNRVDLINSIDGVTFQEAWTNRTETSIDVSGQTVPVYFIGLRELIKNKEAMKRPKDLDDLKYLRKAQMTND